MRWFLQRADRPQMVSSCRAQPRRNRPWWKEVMNRWTPALNAFSITVEGGECHHARALPRYPNSSLARRRAMVTQWTW